MWELDQIRLVNEPNEPVQLRPSMYLQCGSEYSARNSQIRSQSCDRNVLPATGADTMLPLHHARSHAWAPTAVVVVEAAAFILH